MNCPYCDTLIDEHEASRCLDAWVVEKILGWDKVPGTKWLYGNNGDWFDYGNPLTGPLYPSRDIAAAWEVVEKVNQDNAMTLGWYNPDGRISRFTVAFGFGKTIMGNADTAPLAICRAAIKAVGNR